MAREISLTRAAAILGTLLGALLDAGCKESVAPTPITVTGVSPAIGAGFLHTCGLASTGAASCWGDNSKGQVGSDPIGSLILIPVAVSGGRTFSALAAGSPAPGPPTAGATTPPASSATARLPTAQHRSPFPGL